MFAQAVSQIHFVSKKAKILKYKEKSKSASRRLCVPPCPRYLMGGVKHNLCIIFLGVEHALSALRGADCPDCEQLPLCVHRSHLAIFDESCQARDPSGSSPTATEAQQRLLSWESQVD